MKIPKKVQIGPLQYKVKLMHHIHQPDGTALSGDQFAYTQTIRLDRESSKQYQAATLIHETIHAIFENAGFNEDHDEHLINCFSYGFLDLIRQNPDLIDYIQEVLE